MEINYNELLDLSNIEIKEDTSKIDEIIEYEEILFEISKCIINYRKENKLTQKQLAKELEVEQVMISKLESGTYNPTVKLLHKISRTLTGSASLFVNMLENIVETINKMYEMTYNIVISDKEYTETEESKILYMKDYGSFDKIQGGYYETEKGTSTISIA